MDLLNDVLDLIQKFVIIGGGVLLVFGLVNLGTSLSDHNGPGISSAIWKIIGGGVIIAGSLAKSSARSFTEGRLRPPLPILRSSYVQEFTD